MPMTPVVNSMMIRLVERRRIAVRGASEEAPRVGMRENVANGVNAAALTVPLIVAPFPATNATDAPETCAEVTVTTCVPIVGPSVHLTDDLPSLSVLVAVADNVPPPLAVHVNATPETDLLAASNTWTTSAESRGPETAPAWFDPEMILMVVGECEIDVESDLQPPTKSAATIAAAGARRTDIRRTSGDESL